MNLTAVLVCIVVVFLTCHMPRPLLNLIDETVYRKKDMNREMNLAAVLICIVVVFLTCHMPRLLLNLISETVTERRM
jgi:cell division protein FtsL